MIFDYYGNGILIRFSAEEDALLRTVRTNTPSTYDANFGISSLHLKGIDSFLLAERIIAEISSYGSSSNSNTKPSHKILVDYSRGLDNSSLSEKLNLPESEIIALHTQTIWEVALIGFAPGFPYLVPKNNVEIWNNISRLSSPRTKVPKGSVALAAGLSAIYPAEMPGGWNVIGTTDFILFDPKLEKPATLTAGDIVEFTELVNND
jgi:KipI family sensor histidine kinase inhibitor